MKTQTAFIFILLFAISCTKDSTNNEIVQSNQSNSSSAQSLDALMESSDAKQLPVVGKWTLYYDWSCEGGYGVSDMTVRADGTWSSNDGYYTGLWVKGRHIFLFTFNNSETTYSGVICDTKIKGIMSTFNHDLTVYQGCFYMEPLQDNSRHNNRIAGSPDESGKMR
jgi:hypothetical protein